MATPFLWANTHNQTANNTPSGNLDPRSNKFAERFDTTLNEYLASTMNTPLHPQYRNYPQQTPHRSPHASAARRGPGPMISSSNPQPILTPAQAQSQKRDAERKAEEARRRSRRPTDKNIPEGIEDIIIGDGVQRYKELRDMERRLDAVMMRKRLDIQDSVNRNVKTYKTLRIWISNTAENQPWQARGLDENAFDFSTGIEATYKVKIEGRLLDDEDEDELSDSEDETDGGADERNDGEKDAAAMETDGADTDNTARNQASEPPRKKLSHFFKSIVIDFDRSKSLQPDAATQIEWKKPKPLKDVLIPPSATEFDCLEFERKSDENINVTVNLVRDEYPERYRLSKDLAELLDTDESPRAEVVMGIWEYTKAMGLQEDEDKRGMRCDERMRAVFKQDHVFFPHVTDLVQSHLLPLAPIKLPYTIRVDPEYHSSPSPTIYDIRVPLDDPVSGRRSEFNKHINNTNITTLEEIRALDEQLALIIQKIAHSKAKHGYFTSMSKDPAGFVRRWISSQSRDLEVILGEATRGGNEEGQGEEFRRGGADGVWGTDHVRESVGLWLARTRYPENK
ncbi:MAG: hypothetical protein M1827_005279 [Pycnora praestabilis]|nr:MAG: hypothetical protein M1827_005279 [Pycnora praestabilis]